MKFFRVGRDDSWTVKLFVLFRLKFKVRRGRASSLYKFKITDTLLWILNCLDVLHVHYIVGLSVWH